MEQYAKNLGVVIRRHRLVADMAPSALAEAIGVKEENLLEVENGESLLGTQKFIRAAEKLMVLPCTLFFEAEIAHFPDGAQELLLKASRVQDALLRVLQAAHEIVVDESHEKPA